MKLSEIPLRPSTLATFTRRGFASTEDIEMSKSCGMANFAAELGCSMTQAASLAREVKNEVDALLGTVQIRKQASVTAASLIRLHKEQRCIISFCMSIDRMLGGGFALREITEVVGLPGCGKTQLAMQLCVDVGIPKNHGGVYGEAIYIDTEGSFAAERCHTMAKAMVKHVQQAHVRRQKVNPHEPPLPDQFYPEKILDRIHVYRVHNEAAQVATIQSLPTFIENRKKAGHNVCLVVVDSIAFHYRSSPTSSDFMARARSLATTSSLLGELATNYDLAVVAINQMTTKVGQVDESRLAPALGESWAHAATTRVILSHSSPDSPLRKCALDKSPSKPVGTAKYVVKEAGIRDVPSDVQSVLPSKRSFPDG